jgi:hypothetical protein
MASQPSDEKLFDAGDYNLFRYCHNDPIDFTDPMGLEDKREPWYNHQEQAKANDKQDPARRMADEAYNRGMANAQRTMHGAHGGATDIGRAGYNTWFTVTAHSPVTEARTRRMLEGGNGVRSSHLTYRRGWIKLCGYGQASAG